MAQRVGSQLLQQVLAISGGWRSSAMGHTALGDLALSTRARKAGELGNQGADQLVRRFFICNTNPHSRTWCFGHNRQRRFQRAPAAAAPHRAVRGRHAFLWLLRWRGSHHAS